ncbi:hypothetical protein C8J57DRAFT_1537231 [Mycena rebaudengoi]|nr:hypothetical protein C8J57DRAFT_1537231 [Mycena rebaudengoi]
MSRTAIYQTQLDGYVRIARRLRPSTTRREVIDVDTTAIKVIDIDACIFPGLQRFFTFEGKHWYPINVDEGSSEDDAIDVEAWTTLSEALGSWTANDEDTAVPSSSEVWAKARAANVDIFQCCICFLMPNKPVMPLCMHIFCYSCIRKNLGIRNCCPVCRAPIYEAPIRDNAYEMELSDAVCEGLVEPSASDTP